MKGMTKKKVAMTAILGMGMTCSAAFGQNLNKKPADWNNKYVWYSYAETAPQPVYDGPIKILEKDDEDGASGLLDFNTLPLHKAIVRVRGNGKHKVAYFSNARGNGYEEQDFFNKITDITIYTFPLPIISDKFAASDGPLGQYEREDYGLDTSGKGGITDHIMCHPTNQARAQAYDNYKLNDKLSKVSGPCDHGMHDVMEKMFAIFSPKIKGMVEIGLKGRKDSRGNNEIVHGSEIVDPILVVYENGHYAIGNPAANYIFREYSIVK